MTENTRQNHAWAVTGLQNETLHFQCSVSQQSDEFRRSEMHKPVSMFILVTEVQR